MEAKTQAGNESSTTRWEACPYKHKIERESSVLHFSAIRCGLTQHLWTSPPQHAHLLVLAEHQPAKGFVLWLFHLLVHELKLQYCYYGKVPWGRFLVVYGHQMRELKYLHQSSQTRGDPEGPVLISSNFPACFYTAMVHAYFTHLRLVCYHVLP